ncbi:MAG: NAD(P)-binding protein [bacterium]
MIVVKTRKRDIDKIGLKGGRETSSLRPRYRELAPPCVNACPSGIDIRKYITTIAQSEGYKRSYEDSCKLAWEILVDKNPFPAVTGRVCPHFCEKECNRQGKDEAIAINSIEKFIGDFGIENNLCHKRLYNDTFPEKVAIIGGGPSGLSCAYQLSRRGYKTTIFEEKEKLGGMLRYGIPRYRLDEDIIDAEIQRILDLGIEVYCNKKVSLKELEGKYQGIYVAIGGQRGVSLNIKGEENVISGVDFLNKINSSKEISLGNNVIVIGGGNVAIDSARSAKRLKANVKLLYRRTKDQMPAIPEEVEQAEKEGVRIEFLVSPLDIIKDGIRCIRMELTEPDESGRPKPVPIPGSEFNIEADTIIASLSQIPDFTGLEELNDNGWICVDERQKTKRENVFAGGDVTNKLGFVTDAIGMGTRAALAIDEQLREKEPVKVLKPTLIKYTNMNLNYYENLPRSPALSQESGVRSQESDVLSFQLNQGDVIYETKRCMSCGSCFDCDNCYILCSDSAVKRLPKGQHYEFILSNCQGCKKCAEECPCGYIEMI